MKKQKSSAGELEKKEMINLAFCVLFSITVGMKLDSLMAANAGILLMEKSGTNAKCATFGTVRTVLEPITNWFDMKMSVEFG